MNNIPETFASYFYKAYKKDGYLDKYGGSVVATALTLFFFFLVFSYYYVQSKTDPIRPNWANERCHPSVMPFAGWINKPKDKSATEFTSENFMQCTTQILTSIVSYFMQPFYYITDLISKLVGVLQKAINSVRQVLFMIRVAMDKIMSYIVGRLVNVMIPLRLIVGKLRDTMNKTIGIATAALYTVYGAYVAMKAFMGAFLMIIIIALIIAFAAIVILWILPWTWPLAAASTVFYLIISIPMVIIALWMQSILDIASGKAVPGKPSGGGGCFDKNTIIDTEKGPIKIQNLKSGTTLKNGDRITAVFQLALNGEDVYQLDDIIVTGCHKVFHDNLGWIDVRDHPSSQLITDYREPTIYNLSTESKRFNIKNHKFLDWDDLEPFDIIKLKNLNYLDNNSSLSDIHKYLESGIDGNTLVDLENGQSIKLKNIKLNDQLYSGERVLGIVEIDTKNICAVKKYTFNQFSIIGSPNIHFKDSDLGIFNTLNKDGKIINKPKKLYHLVTDTGKFNINGYTIKDYNAAMEDILDIRDKLFALF